jgi:dTDP-4-amino-4,6-dideoxygalactose transaminase
MANLAIRGGPPARSKPWPQWPVWGNLERKALSDVLESGTWGGYSDRVAAFERAWAEYHNASYSVATANGTLSLVAALRAVNIGPGDEVIVPPYTFVATATAPLLVGATPVFADIEPETWNLNPDAVAAAITSRTRAIIPVHFAGHPADLDRLLPLAERHGLFVVEDAAHAPGAEWRGQRVGPLGHVGSFSFQASKNLTAGEGGMLVTNDNRVAEVCWSVANQGRVSDGAWYEHSTLGSNYRLTGWQAAILLSQLERLDEQIERRMANARWLRDALSGESLQPQAWDERVTRHGFHLFIVRYDPELFGGLPREDFLTALGAEGVPCSPGYPYPLYGNRIFEGLPAHEQFLTTGTGPCPIAEAACRESIWFKHSLLLGSEADVGDIVTAVRKIKRHLNELR